MVLWKSGCFPEVSNMMNPTFSSVGTRPGCVHLLELEHGGKLAAVCHIWLASILRSHLELFSVQAHSHSDRVICLFWTNHTPDLFLHVAQTTGSF